MVPQEQKTIVAIAQKRAEETPNNNYITFLVDGDDCEEKLSYAELNHSATKVAHWLNSKDIHKGDRALVILPNSINFVNIFYGCLYAGVMAVPLSEPSGPHQMQSYLETFIPTIQTSKPKVLITTPMLVEFITKQMPEKIKPLFAEMTIISDQAVLDAEAPAFDLPELFPEDTAYLQFTSGSTGTPKGIMIGHCNIMSNMKQAWTSCDWEEGNGTALWLPLFHDFGLAAGLIGALYMGGFAILTTPVNFILKPIRWLRMISKYKCAHSYAPPFAYEICRKKISEDEKKTLDLSSLICSVYGAEPVHYEGVRLFNDYFSDCGLKPNAIRPGFGMAETVIMFSVSEQLSGLCVDRKKLETEQKAVIVDEGLTESEKKMLVNLGGMMNEHEIVIKNDHNQAVPEGEIGEILISGPSVCQGYFENPEATKKVFQQEIEGKDEQYLSTGDLGLLWKGDLYFTGRIKDLIIIRGRNYYPQDIEYALTQIKELRAGCIVAYADENESGEILCVAMEIRKDLLKDMEIFNEYVLPSIDQKITELIGLKFQIYPGKRTYLEPGVIAKTSSGKIKHQKNVARFKENQAKGVLAVLTEERGTVDSDTDIESVVKKLFRSIVEIEPVMDEPFLDLGGDSIKVVEFVETLQEKYPSKEDIMDDIDDQSTLIDIINWFQKRR